MTSNPIFCSIITAATIGDILALALGPSGILIASIPDVLHNSTFSNIGAKLIERGGVISIDKAFSFPDNNFLAKLLFSIVSVTAIFSSMGVSIFVIATCVFTPLKAVIVFAIALMCWSFVPQQPPTPLTPKLI